MKRFFRTLTVAAMTVLSSVNVLDAEIPVTVVDRVLPTDMVFMDMATEAAKASVAKNGLPQGVVFTLNGSVKSTGNGKNAFSEALTKSGSNSLPGAVVYSVNRPSTEDYLSLSESGVSAIYFVNDKDEVVKAGILPESAYSESDVPEGFRGAQLKSMEYPDAQSVIK